MRTHLILLTSILVSACSSPVSDSRPGPDPDGALGAVAGCYTVEPRGAPAPDVSLPTLIELSQDPASGFVDPGRFAVREPGASEALAPLSWWAPDSESTIHLVLGGGYTGYHFSLRPGGQGGWTGTGTYFADFGVEPTPALLPVRLRLRSCP